MKSAISPRGRGRGRGRRGRPPSIRKMEMEKDDPSVYMKLEDENGMSPEHGEPHQEDTGERGEKENVGQSSNPTPVVDETRREEPLAWPLPDGAASMGIDPSNLVNLNMHVDEDEDYDNED